MFSTAATTTTLYARTSGFPDVPLAAGLIGSPHRYRIDWTATQVVYSVDGMRCTHQPVRPRAPICDR